jgi:hypothetical protein
MIKITITNRGITFNAENISPTEEIENIFKEFKPEKTPAGYRGNYSIYIKRKGKEDL